MVRPRACFESPAEKCGPFRHPDDAVAGLDDLSDLLVLAGDVGMHLGAEPHAVVLQPLHVRVSHGIEGLGAYLNTKFISQG